jgi:hypothetical protein
MRWSATVIAVALATGCSSSPSLPAAAPGPQVSVGQFTGEWLGSYRGHTFKRDGTLSILIEAADSAASVADRVPVHGQVKFGGVPRNRRDSAFPLTADERRNATEQTVPVDSARLTANGIVLWLQSYHDPGCSCTVSLTARGSLRGDTLVGTYSAETGPTNLAERRGRWRVVRQRTP